MATKKNPAVDVAKSLKKNGEPIIELTTGFRAKLSPVAAGLIDEVVSRIEDPEVPTFFNENKGREEPNPHDPSYQKALMKADKDRTNAAFDAMILFGVELVDGIPEEKTWVKKLKRLGIIFDDNDPDELEFHFLKHVAVSSDDLKQIAANSGIGKEALERAEKTFPSS